ncbi:hypothetical protein GW17_00011417 [Ensete ventricosum]|nr:hypothetical protein GW17_00011417 [Ensete ventricosum]
MGLKLLLLHLYRQVYRQTLRLLDAWHAKLCTDPLVSYLLENTGDRVGALQIIVAYNVYPLLLSCLVDGYADHLARIRILALVAKLFSLSSSIATAVYSSNLLNLFEVEINNGHDMLTTLSALELLYEVGTIRFFCISNSSVDSMLRSRAALISGRILSSSDAYAAVDISSVTALLAAIDERLKVLGGQNTDEYESELEALGLIGSNWHSYVFVNTMIIEIFVHVIESAFDRHSRGKQLAGLHALASICGVDRPEDKTLLDNKAEENLRRLIYTAAANTSKLNPSVIGLTGSNSLRTTTGTRNKIGIFSHENVSLHCKLQGYRLISGLVVRPWCLMEICLNQEIITIATDAKIETAKNGMDARHHCCTAISTALSSSNLLQDAAVARTAAKLQEAVRRGPYVTKGHVEAQPVVMTAERF